MDSDYIRVFIPGHKMMPNAWHHKKLATIVSLMHLSSMGFLVHDQSLSRSLKSLIPRADATIDFSTTPLPLRTQLPFHLVLPAHGYLLRTDALKHACCFFICKCKWPRCAQKAEKIINAVFFLIFEAIWKQERFSGVKKKKSLVIQRAHQPERERIQHRADPCCDNYSNGTHGCCGAFMLWT